MRPNARRLQDYLKPASVSRRSGDRQAGVPAPPNFIDGRTNAGEASRQLVPRIVVPRGLRRLANVTRGTSPRPQISCPINSCEHSIWTEDYHIRNTYVANLAARNVTFDRR